MQVSVTDAKAVLTDLVRRAEAGEEIILTRHGHSAAGLVPIPRAPDRATRRALLEAFRGVAGGSSGPSAARSQDFLYDEDGLPG